jgi:hypothetical protein
MLLDDRRARSKNKFSLVRIASSLRQSCSGLDVGLNDLDLRGCAM